MRPNKYSERTRAPDVPTIDKAGVPGLHLSLWNGIWAPRGTLHDGIMKLNGVIR